MTNKERTKAIKDELKKLGYGSKQVSVRSRYCGYSDATDIVVKDINCDINKIEELEKENAELKGLKDVATLIRANNDTVVTLMQLNNMLVSKSQQLAKATDLLKKVIKVTWGEGWNYSLDVKVESEQFISEVEK